MKTDAEKKKFENYNKVNVAHLRRIILRELVFVTHTLTQISAFDLGILFGAAAISRTCFAALAVNQCNTFTGVHRKQSPHLTPRIFLLLITPCGGIGDYHAAD